MESRKRARLEDALPVGKPGAERVARDDEGARPPSVVLEDEIDREEISLERVGPDAALGDEAHEAEAGGKHGQGEDEHPSEGKADEGR